MRKGLRSGGFLLDHSRAAQPSTSAMQASIALVIQAVGGASASGAVHQNKNPAPVSTELTSIAISRLINFAIRVAMSCWAVLYSRWVRYLSTHTFPPEFYILRALVSITVYVALATEFVLRYLSDRPVRSINGSSKESSGPRYLDKKTKLMLASLSFSSLTIFIR